MTEAAVPVHLSGPLLEEISNQASRTGLSLESWLVSVAAERIREQQATERFFGHPPLPSDGKTLLDILNSANDGAAMPSDELPPAFR